MQVYNLRLRLQVKTLVTKQRKVKSCNPFHLGMTTVGMFGQCLLQVIVGKFLAFSLDCFHHPQGLPPSLAHSRQSINICRINTNCQVNGWQRNFRPWTCEQLLCLCSFSWETKPRTGMWCSLQVHWLSIQRASSHTEAPQSKMQQVERVLLVLGIHSELVPRYYCNNMIFLETYFEKNQSDSNSAKYSISSTRQHVTIST